MFRPIPHFNSITLALIACVGGAFAGAHWGLGERGVPQGWINQVEGSDYLLTLADRLRAAAL